MEDQAAHDDVPAVRDALDVSPTAVPNFLFGVRPRSGRSNVDPVRAAELVEFGWADYPAWPASIGCGGSCLSLIWSPHSSSRTASPAQGDRAARPVCSLSVSARTPSRRDDAEQGRRGGPRVDRGRAPMKAADRLTIRWFSPRLPEPATHALLAVGRYDDALTSGTPPHGWVRRWRTSDPTALSLSECFTAYGGRGSSLAGPHDCQRFIDRTGLRRNSSGRTGTTGRRIGPTNVELHRLSAGLDLGDVTGSSTGGGGRHRSSPGRAPGHALIDLARAPCLTQGRRCASGPSESGAQVT